MLKPLTLVTSLLMGFLAAPALAVNNCPEVPGQTHEQIIHKVEGRLNGDWSIAIKTVDRSIKRQKEKGEDTTEAELYRTVLYCLKEAVGTGEYADIVAGAKGNPLPADSGEAPVQTSEAPEPMTTEPTTPEPTTPEIVPAEAAPGTAESYNEPIVIDSNGIVTPEEPPAQTSSVPTGGYVGQACAFFTRPAQEVINGISYNNTHSEGSWVCHEGNMYACSESRWTDKGACTQYDKWETRLSQVLEVR